MAGRVVAVAVKGGKQGVRSLPVPRLGWLSLPVVRRVCLSGSAAQPLEALSSIRVVHRVCPCRVQMVKAKYLLELLSHRAVRARVSLAGQVKPALFPLAQQVGSHQQPGTRRRLVARLRGSAAEYSLDFRS